MATSYIGLEYGYKAILMSQKAEADQQAEELITGVPVEKQEAVIDFYSRLANMRAVLQNHVYTTQFLRLLEGSTSKGVYFSSLKLAVDEQEVQISGVARNYDELSVQLKALAAMAGVSDVTLTSAITAENGQAVFDVNFNFDRQEFRRKQ